MGVTNSMDSWPPATLTLTERYRAEERARLQAAAKADAYQLRRVEESLRRNLCLSGAATEAELVALDGHLSAALRMADALLERARG